MNGDELRKYLADQICMAGSQGAYARQIGVNAPALSVALKGSFPPVLLRALGVTVEKVYRMAPKEDCLSYTPAKPEAR